MNGRRAYQIERINFLSIFFIKTIDKFHKKVYTVVTVKEEANMTLYGEPDYLLNKTSVRAEEPTFYLNCESEPKLDGFKMKEIYSFDDIKFFMMEKSQPLLVLDTIDPVLISKLDNWVVIQNMKGNIGC